MDRQLLPYTTLLVKEVNTSWTDSFTTGRRVCDMSGNRLTAVFGPYSPSTSSIVRSICENLGVPNIQAHWDMSHRPPGRCHINIHPDHNTMEQAYETVVKEYLQWKSFAFLYESDDALKRLQSVLQIHGPGDPPVTIRKIIPGGDNRPLLKEMYNFTETHIIVDCDTNNVISLLQQAKEVGMMGDYQGYFITSLDAHTLDWSEFLHHQTNLTFLRIVDPSRAKVQNAIQDWGYNERRYGRVLDLHPETVRCIGPPSSDSPGKYDEKRYRVLDLRPETVRCIGPPSRDSPGRYDEKRYSVLDLRLATVRCIGPPSSDSPGKYDEKRYSVLDLRPETVRCIGPPSSDSSGKYDEKRYSVLDLRLATVRTEAALMYDAVQVFAKALHEVDLAENVKMPSLSCDSEEPWDYGPTIIDYMKQARHKDGFYLTFLEFPGMTGMVRFDEEGRRTDLSLDVVEVYRDGVTKTAVWDSINGLSLVRSYNDTLAEVQRNVQDKIFIVASIIGEPYLTYTKPLGEYTGNDRFEGYSKDLIEAIAENLKFKGYQLILARDGISILFSQLPKEPPNVFSFLKPFSFDVWLCMATAYLGVSIILFVLCRQSLLVQKTNTARLASALYEYVNDKRVRLVVDRSGLLYWTPQEWVLDLLRGLTPYEWDNPHPCDPDPEELENSFNMLNCLWFSIGSLMAAGCDILPK
uniref:Ionotropic glutamate receptor L-glutamate and glycine-binding domain-containing protein n=1 Tax=Timema genevievae TaxID=629358 RepID=A0A7R9K1F7_TIMGE|nr:unnamed protein product [Timema genevievae]